jgi:hypothetical protein
MTDETQNQSDPAANEQMVVEPTAEEFAMQAEAPVLALRMAHPHRRLTELQTTMQAPGTIDVNARIGMLHNVVSRLIQIIKEHTPAPEED